jgi:replicative DNA helicase
LVGIKGVDVSIGSSEHSERAVLGAVFIAGSDAVHEAVGLGITAEHFSIPSHRKVWELVSAEVDSGRPPEVGFIAERYPRDVKSCGGLSFLTSLSSSCGSLALLPQYVENILEANRRARMVLAAKEVLQAAADDEHRADHLQVIMENALNESSKDMGIQEKPESVEDIIREWSNKRAMVLSGESKDTELKWDLFALDRFVLAGPGHLIVIGGRPKMGKTQLAVSLMANIARKSGPALFCSAEMGKEALARRILSSTMDIRTRDSTKFALGFEETVKGWQGVPLMFDYKARTVRKVCASIRQAKRKFDIGAAAVDYLQLLEMDGARSEEEEIGRASKTFKGLAEELEIPILLLVQVNRKCEDRTDKRPLMSDIRGSGRVEQDADAVVFVYREVYYNERFPRPSQVELIVRANRHGPTGTGMSFWSPGSGWFKDPTHQWGEGSPPR